MKKTVQPVMRKVYSQTTNAQDIQMNAVRKINSLLSSGAVSVTGPTQSKILKQHQKTVFVQKGECYICDEHIGNGGTLVTEAFTTVTNTKLPTKIGRIVGDAFVVIIGLDDVICKRCLAMFNHMDKLESDLDRVKGSILNLINNKYGINDVAGNEVRQPPTKVQRLSGGNAPFNRKTSNGGGAGTESEDDGLVRKVAVPLLQPIQSPQQRVLNISGGSNDPIENQLSGMFEANERPQNNYVQQQVVRQVNATTTSHTQVQPAQQRKPIKIYKCMSCDFKTTDLKQFQPHYDTCRRQNGDRCKICKAVFPSTQALKQHNAEKHASETTCSTCAINFSSEAAFKKHMETNHGEVKAIDSTNAVSTGQLYTCNMCSFKSNDKPSYDVHLRQHVKVKPFKCRICSSRFETREQAGIHAKTHCPDLFKCGTCSMSFSQRDQLMKHFESHNKSQQQPMVQLQQKQIVQQVQQSQQQQQPQAVNQELSTQKLLQETINEALRDSGEAAPKINFFSCHICSLTFIQENYYKQHMETHKRENKKAGTVTSAVTTPTSSNAHSLIRQDTRITSTPTTIIQSQPTTSISDTDLEIMFEKMHSDKAEIEGNANNAEGLVITSQESASGGYTFNITMPTQHGQETDKTKQDGLSSVGIDMPVLDQSEEQQLQLQHQQQLQQQHEQEQQQQEQSEQQHQTHDGLEDGEHAQGPPVSMPSLDDDGDSSQPSNTDQVPMDLDDIQNAAESGQIKFILNENGQLLQLDNHILTTDADGNQILVQGTDSEQIQQLLQSVGVLHGDGDGETFQMIQGENNQMILVQGDNNEAQLIDASMLNEDGHLVIQQHGDGELPEGMHVVNEDGIQVPVSIAFAQHIDDSAGDQQHHQQQHHQEEEEEDLEQQHHQLQQEQQDHQDSEQQQMLVRLTGGLNRGRSKGLTEVDEPEQQQQDHEQQQQQNEEEQMEQHEQQQQQQETQQNQEETSIKLEEESQVAENLPTSNADTDVQAVTTSTTTPVTSASGEVYFNLEDLMNQSDQK